MVGFSVAEVYALAEAIRRQRGGAAVVLGALSPRTRNAQVALYQAGEVDYLVATDAIGMGLNMDVNHVAFARRRKFDGRQIRDLGLAEIAQIAGRAGRHMNDGTFGVTNNTGPFDEELVEAIEAHEFEPLTALVWRNRRLDFRSPAPAAQPGTRSARRLPGARARGRRPACACAPLPATGDRRSGRQAGTGPPVVGGVPDPRLPQDHGGPSHRPAAPHLPFTCATATAACPRTGWRARSTVSTTPAATSTA